MKRTFDQARTVVAARTADEVKLQEARIGFDPTGVLRLVLVVKYQAAGAQVGSGTEIVVQLTATQADRLKTILQAALDAI